MTPFIKDEYCCWLMENWQIHIGWIGVANLIQNFFDEKCKKGLLIYHNKEADSKKKKATTDALDS